MSWKNSRETLFTFKQYNEELFSFWRDFLALIETISGNMTRKSRFRLLWNEEEKKGATRIKDWFLNVVWPTLLEFVIIGQPCCCQSIYCNRLGFLEEEKSDLDFLRSFDTTLPHCSKSSFPEKNCQIVLGENASVLDFLAVDNFDFTRKIVKKILSEKLVKMLGICTF